MTASIQNNAVIDHTDKHAGGYLVRPASQHAVLTPNDTTDISPRPRALYINTAGDVQITDENGVSVTYASVAAGTILPFSPVRLGSATTATVVGWI